MRDDSKYRKVLAKELGHIDWDKLKTAYADWKESGEYAALEALDAHARGVGPADPMTLARSGMSLDAWKHYGIEQQRLYVDTLLRYHERVEQVMEQKQMYRHHFYVTMVCVLWVYATVAILM